jgi:putative ABC transport system permease protein
MLFEISAYDPGTLMLATGVLTVVVAAACLVPAFRATRVDPMVAIRSE